MSAKLSEREAKFVHAFVGEAAGNATQAAVLSGASSKSAGRIGYRLSKRVHVAEAIEAAHKRVVSHIEASGLNVIEEVCAIASAKVEKVTTAEKLKALELAAKLKGLLSDRTHESRITVNIGFLTNNNPAIDATPIGIQLMPPRATVGVIAQD